MRAEAFRIGITFLLVAITSLVASEDYATAPGRVLHPSILAVPGANPRPERVISSRDFPHNLAFIGTYELLFGPGQKLLSNSKAVDIIAEGWNVEATFRYQSEPPSALDNAIFQGDIKAVPLPSDQRSVDRRINVNSGFERGSALQPSSSLRKFQTWLGTVHTNPTGSAFGSVTSENSAGRLMRLGPKVKFQ